MEGVLGGGGAFLSFWDTQGWCIKWMAFGLSTGFFLKHSFKKSLKSYRVTLSAAYNPAQCSTNLHRICLLVEEDNRPPQF